MRRLLAVLAAVLALAPAAFAAPRPEGPVVLHRQGRWLVDAAGRVVLLHGVNAVWKRVPYVPPQTAAGFTDRDAQWIADQGFNTVRLGVIFAGVMPTRGKVDQGYLDRVARIVDELAARKVWVLLDFHQDLYSEKFSGEGFPAWAVHDDGLPQPVDAGFPGNYFLPATSRAFDNFYADVDGLADLYAQAWQAVALRFRRTSYVLGYDVINEPWPGTQAATCLQPVGCPVFDQQSLQPLYAKVLKAIRAVDPQRLVWVEPHALFGHGVQTHLGSLGDNGIGLSFHQYCTSASFTHSHGGTAGPDCPVQGGLVFDNADSAADANGWTSLLTEFGASDDLGDLTTVTANADSHLVGWQYWHYKEWADPTTESQGSGGQGLFTNDADLSTVKQAKADVLIRPYPRAVAGVPASLWFDAGASRALLFLYHARPGVTEVFLPHRQYPHGYVVQVKGPVRVVSRPGATLLLLRNTGAGSVQVVVEPKH